MGVLLASRRSQPDPLEDALAGLLDGQGSLLRPRRGTEIVEQLRHQR